MGKLTNFVLYLYIAIDFNLCYMGRIPQIFGQENNIKIKPKCFCFHLFCSIRLPTTPNAHTSKFPQLKFFLVLYFPPCWTHLEENIHRNLSHASLDEKNCGRGVHMHWFIFSRIFYFSFLHILCRESSCMYKKPESINT